MGPWVSKHYGPRTPKSKCVPLQITTGTYLPCQHPQRTSARYPQLRHSSSPTCTPTWNTPASLNSDFGSKRTACHVLLCTILYHTMPFYANLCHTMPYCAILCHNVLRCTIRYHVIPYDTIRYHAIPYDTVHIQCHAILYRWNVLHHTVLDYTTPCHAIPY